MRVVGRPWGVTGLEDRADAGAQFLAAPVEFDGAASVDDAPQQMVPERGRRPGPAGFAAPEGRGGHPLELESVQQKFKSSRESSVVRCGVSAGKWGLSED